MTKKPKKPKQTPEQVRHQKIWKLADQSDLLRDGELELDLNAKVSEGDSNGSYIQTWMWVSYAETDLDKGDPPGPKDWSPIKKPEPDRKKIMALARNSRKLRDGELELDNGAVISEGDDNGAYVQVWMWVPFAETPLDKED